MKNKRKFYSIATMITLVSIILTVAVAVTATFYAMTNSKNVLKTQTKEMLKNSAKGYADELSSDFIVFENTIKSITNYITVNYDVNMGDSADYNSTFLTGFSKYLAVESTSDSNILGVWSFLNTNRTTELNYAWYEGGAPRDIGDRAVQYQLYLENDEKAIFHFAHQTEQLGQAQWQGPRYDEGLDCYTVTYAQPVYIGDYYYGMVGLGIKLTSIEAIAESIKLYDTGQAFVVDNYGNFLAHRDYDSNVNIKDSEYREMADLDMGVVAVNGKYLAWNKMFNGYKVFLEVPEKEVMTESNSIQTKVIIMCIILIVIGAIVMALLSRFIVRPVMHITRDLNLASEGKFTGSNYKKYKKHSNEVGILANSFENMQSSVRNTVETIKDSTVALSDSTQTLSRVIDRFTDQSSSISAATEELAAGTDETYTIVEGLNSSFDLIVKDLGTLNLQKEQGIRNIGEIEKRALELKNTAERDKQEVSRQIEISGNKLEQAIEESKQVEQIRELSSAILEIADKTNLLSLNASIEAARAGESGKGFAVVANEIGNLASVSQETAKRIQEIVNSVMASVEGLGAVSRNITEYLNKEVFSILESLNSASGQYSSDAGNIASVLENISALSENIESKTKNTFESLDVLLKSAQQGAAGTNELADNTEKIVTGAAEVEKEAEELKRIITALLESVSDFEF